MHRAVGNRTSDGGRGRTIESRSFNRVLHSAKGRRDAFIHTMNNEWPETTLKEWIGGTQSNFNPQRKKDRKKSRGKKRKKLSFRAGWGQRRETRQQEKKKVLPFSSSFQRRRREREKKKLQFSKKLGAEPNFLTTFSGQALLNERTFKSQTQYKFWPTRLATLGPITAGKR